MIRYGLLNVTVYVIMQAKKLALNCSFIKNDDRLLLRYDNAGRFL